MNTNGGTRSRRVLAALLGVALFALAACDYDFNAETLHVVDAQEEGFFSDGDEPYLAVIEWRSTPGEPGSTRTQYKGGLYELSSGAEDGDVLNIGASVGSSDINDIQFASTLAQVVSGEAPELVGTVMIAMESDATPWWIIDNMMIDVKDALHTELAGIIEPLTLADLADPGALATRLSNASINVQNAVTPSIFEALGIWLASLGDPDDLIGVGFEVWVAASGELGSFIDGPIQAALPSNAVGGILKPDEVRTLRFSGDGATYDVNLRTVLEDV